MTVPDGTVLLDAVVTAPTVSDALAIAVDAAPWLVGDSDQADELPPDQMFEKLKPFKDRVAEDIREESS